MKHTRDGFTLIEILMVVTLIGLMASFAVPKIDIRSYRINGAVRSAAGVLGQAQRMAVTKQMNVNVLFDVSTNAIKIHEDDDNDNVIDGNERVRAYPLGDGVTFGLGSAPARTFTPSPVSFTRRLGGLPQIIFRRDGSASENGGFYITSTGNSRTKDARSIEVSRASGRVEWYRYSGSAWQRRP